jgi:hypothetical protein
MFTGSLRFNLDPVGKVSDGKLLKVIRSAELEDLLERDQ